MSTRSKIDLPRLETLAKGVPNIFDVKRDDDSVMFKFKDKDKDTVAVLVNELDEERIVAMMEWHLDKVQLLP